VLIVQNLIFELRKLCHFFELNVLQSGETFKDLAQLLFVKVVVADIQLPEGLRFKGELREEAEEDFKLIGVEVARWDDQVAYSRAYVGQNAQNYFGGALRASVLVHLELLEVRGQDLTLGQLVPDPFYKV
jgi:hypothetical protein